ncbi:hypothetical protein GCM10027416_29310 [Okibacterium endophyticum]
MVQPNVLWISTHDINPHLGAYSGQWPGAEEAITPNLDRLAAEGVRYDRAFAAAPICAPSRSAMMTGCFPTAIGAMHMRTKSVPPPEVRLLPEYFREAGYYTTNNFFTDFQVRVPATTFDVCGPEAHWRNRPDTSTPFFAMFHGMTTHESRLYIDDDEFAALTADVTDEQRRDPDAVQLPPYHPDTQVFRRTWARYHELITQMDHWAGDLLRQLEEDGLAENTIVVFWSDHGQGMPRGKRWVGETGLREPLIVRWPGHLPAGSARRELVHLMDLAPTMLTACGLDVPEHMHGKPLFTGNGPGDDWHVTDGWDFTYGGRDRFDEQEDVIRTVRDRRFRYVRNYHPDRSPMQHSYYPDSRDTWREFRRLAFEEAGQLARGREPDLLSQEQRRIVAASKPREELYDSEQDPYESVNLVDDPRYAEDLARLSAALDAWQLEYGDLGMMPESALLRSWRPDGQWPVTADPVVEHSDATTTITCPTEGAVLGWTYDDPRPVRPWSPLADATGDPELDDRHWQLWNGPYRPEAGRSFWVRAWRLGYQTSSDVRVTRP